MRTGPNPSSPPALPGPIRHAIGRALLLGVSVAAAIEALGVVLLALRDPGTALTGPVSLPIGHLAAGLTSGDPYAVLLLGLLVLVATPLLRVGLSILGYVEERDRAFVGFTGFALVMLALSALLGVVL